MRKIFIAFIICLFALPCFAEDCNPCKEKIELAKMNGYILGAGSAAALTYCNSCPDAANGADKVCEDCSSGDEDGLCNWAVTDRDDAYCDINFNGVKDDSPALGCTDLTNSYALSLIQASDSTYNCFAVYTLSLGATTDLYGQFYFKVISTDLADTETHTVLIISASGSYNNAFGINIHRYGADLYLDGWSSYGPTVDQGSQAIATDTWYGVRFAGIASTNPDTFQWWVDYSNNGTWTDEGTTTGNFTQSRTYAHTGEGAGNKLINFQLVGIKLNTAAMPTACLR